VTCAECGERLDGWLQGRLDAAASAEVEAHLRTCATCRRTFEDARALQDAARRITGRGPSDEAWARLAARLEPMLARRAAAAAEVQPPLGGARRWRGLALAAMLAAVIGASLFGLHQSFFEEAPAPAAAEVPTPGALVESIEQELAQAAEHYERAISGLEQVASETDAPIDPQVMATLRENLRIIDEAIDESRAALREEPTSRIAQESLFDAFRRKVALLQDTIALMNEMRRGNQAGAASIATGLSEG
jgi:anti-sigma factor RsiW